MIKSNNTRTSNWEGYACHLLNNPRNSCIHEPFNVGVEIFGILGILNTHRSNVLPGRLTILALRVNMLKFAHIAKTAVARVGRTDAIFECALPVTTASLEAAVTAAVEEHRGLNYDDRVLC